jgi:hypothetical protein
MMKTPNPHSSRPPLSRRDADFLLVIFRGFRAIAAEEARTLASPSPKGRATAPD